MDLYHAHRWSVTRLLCYVNHSQARTCHTSRTPSVNPLLSRDGFSRTGINASKCTCSDAACNCSTLEQNWSETKGIPPWTANLAACWKFALDADSTTSLAISEMGSRVWAYIFAVRNASSLTVPDYSSFQLHLERIASWLVSISNEVVALWEPKSGLSCQQITPSKI